MALKKPDWEKNVVYLIQAPRAASVANGSPFSLKLETWLRIANLRYEAIDNRFTKNSRKGQVPFVEINGKQIADSGFIINELTALFNKEGLENHLTAEDRAIATAFDLLIENEISQLIIIYRGKDPRNMIFGDSMYGQNHPFPKILLGFISSRIKSALEKRMFHIGPGRHSLEEFENIVKLDLKAVSTYLADKAYMAGDTPTRLDATAFGHLSQLWYATTYSDNVKNFIKSDCENIVSYLDRIRDEFWPDWKQCCETFSMETEWRRGQRPSKAWSEHVNHH